jgi:hypothetical protein
LSTPTIEGLFGGTDSEEDQVVSAAKALREAVANHKGKRKSLVAWKPVVAKVLRVTKLYTKRYQAVLDKGEELGLFRVDKETLSYAIIVPLEPEELPDEITEEEPPPPKQEPKPVVSKVPRQPPEDWNPPRYLDCGHWEYQMVPRPREEGVDPRLSTSSILVHATSPEDCPACKAGRPGHPQRQTKAYRTPVPMDQRRTADKESQGGFPGYCCDEEGYYIGGVANHCRYSNPKGPHCAVHGGPQAEGAESDAK